jgi:Tfp pilus assembly protein PilN
MKAVNLLPSEHRGTPKSAAGPAKPEKAGTTPFGAYVVLGVLAFAVAATALTVLAGNTIKTRKAELARVTAEAQATQAKAAALQTYADFNSLATQRISTVKGLADSRFNWDQALVDLSRALPADVHLRTLNGGTTASTSGSGSSISAPSIQLTGCTKDQVSVARLMSRLRNVRGVTRVSLTGSQEADAAASAANASAAESGSLCPKGSPPDFDLTMYFERAAKPAGAAVNAAATPAAGTASAAVAAVSTATPTTTQGTSAK